jgi:hypothetical protein
MTTPTPITDAVQAALIYVRNDYEEGGQWDLACDKIHSEILNKDRGRGAPQLAAAARILADEVERLRAEPQTIALSNCCQATAVVAGKPNSTQWYVCPQCCQPCDVFIRETTQQPE